MSVDFFFFLMFLHHWSKPPLCGVMCAWHLFFFYESVCARVCVCVCSADSQLSLSAVKHASQAKPSQGWLGQVRGWVWHTPSLSMYGADDYYNIIFNLNVCVNSSQPIFQWEKRDKMHRKSFHWGGRMRSTPFLRIDIPLFRSGSNQALWTPV